MANSLVNLVDHHPHILDDWKQIIKKMFRLGFKVIMYSFLCIVSFHYVCNLDSIQQLNLASKQQNAGALIEKYTVAIQISFVHILNLFTLPLI